MSSDRMTTTFGRAGSTAGAVAGIATMRTSEARSRSFMDPVNSVPPGESSFQLFDQCGLGRFDLPFRHGNVKELGSVDLGKLRLPARPGGPFERKHVAHDRRAFAVTRECPGVNELPALLPHRLQRLER